MDPGAWSTYSQHYSRLGGSVNPAASPLPQPGQLNDIPLSAPLPRQDPMATYSGAAPTLLLPAHATLNVSQGVTPSDATFVNSNLLSTSYDPMLSFPPATKGHLGALNMTHPNPALFKTIGKESELNELRGGFSRRNIPPGGMAADPNMAGMATASATMTSGGIYNSQASPHSWHPTEIMPTPSSPFGVLPHEAVLHRSNKEPTSSKSHSQSSKSSRNIVETSRFVENDLSHSYRNVLSSPVHTTTASGILDPSASTRPTIMMHQSDSVPAVTENLPISSMKTTDYLTYHNNPNMSTSRNTLLPQNYISQSHFTTLEVSSDKRNIYNPPPGKGDIFTTSMKANTNTTSSDLFGHTLTSSVNTTTAPMPAHNSSRIQQSPSSSVGSVETQIPAHTGTPSGQSHSGEIDDYSNYSAPPPIPTNSQSYLANQLPSPSAPHQSLPSGSTIDYSNNQGTIDSQNSSSQMNQSRYSAMSNSDPTSSTASLPSPNVAYSSVITRTNLQTGTSAYPESPLLSLNKNGKLKKNDSHPSSPLPPARGLKLSNASYDQVMKNPSISESECIVELPNASLPSDIPTNLSNMSKRLMNQALETGLMPSSSMSLDLNGTGQVATSDSPKDLSMDSMFNGQQMTLQDLDEISSTNASKINLESGVQLMPSSKESVPSNVLDSSNPHIVSSANMLNHMEMGSHAPKMEIKSRRGRGRRGRKKHEPISERSLGIHITPMTPVRAEKLGHKVVQPDSLPLRGSAPPQVQSPHAPMDLSAPEPSHISQLEHLQHVGSSSHLNVSCSIDTLQDGGTPASNSSVTGSITPTQPSTSQIPVITSQELNHLSPPQLPSTPLNNPGTSVEKSPVKTPSYPTIEDDLGFLAELPPVCNIAAQNTRKVGSHQSKISSLKPLNKQGSFLDSFLKFVKGDAPPQLSSVTQRKGGRGRGRGGYSSSLRAESPAVNNTVSGRVELNPTTGFFVRSQSPTPPPETKKIVGEMKIERSQPTLQSTNNSDTKLTRLDYDSRKEEPKFLSDDEGSPPSISMYTFEKAMKTLSDDDDKTHISQPCVIPVSSKMSESNTAGESKHPELKIKVVGLQTARRGRGRARVVLSSPKRKSRSNDSDDNFESSPPSPNPNKDWETLGIDDDEEPSVAPRRLSMRKCKEKVLLKREEKLRKKLRRISGTGGRSDSEDFISISSSESEKEEIVYDSDTDPAWTPFNKESEITRAPSSGSEEEGRRRSFYGRGRRRSRSGSYRGRGRAKRIRADFEDCILDDDELDEERKLTRGRPIRTREEIVHIPTTVPVSTPEINSNSLGKGITGRLNNGEFVIAIADLDKEFPPIWRVDGKSLLQKFEPYEEDGKMLYKNKSTYAGWTSNSRSQYQTINVRLIVANRNNSVVEYIRETKEESPKPEEELAEDENMIGIQQQKESFEVFIQTLISQALDSNFISEIIKENDEYFLSHMQEIDAVAETCKKYVLRSIEWTDNLKAITESYPCITISDTQEDLQCQICQAFPVEKYLQFYGTLYNYSTLIYLNEDSAHSEENKEFKVCALCAENISLFSKVHHQKFNFYIQCSARVNEIKEEDPNKESHLVLEQCLQDAVWINELFQDAQTVWDDCRKMNR